MASIAGGKGASATSSALFASILDSVNAALPLAVPASPVIVARSVAMTLLGGLGHGHGLTFLLTCTRALYLRLISK